MFLPPLQHRRPVASGLPKSQASHPVRDVVTRCLKEFAVSIASTAAVSCFVAPPSLLVMISASAVQLAANLCLQSLGAFLQKKQAQQGGGRMHYEWVLSGCKWGSGLNFALLTGYNTQNLIHESGHALASLCIYKRPQPVIEIYPFVGGLTQFYKTGLSLFGKILGPSASTCLIVASGPGLTLLISSVLLGIGIRSRQHHPELSKYLICWSMLDFFAHAQYAYSALKAERWNLTHDFVHLSVFGLDPAVAAIGILSIPVLIAIGSTWKQWTPPEAAPMMA